MVDLNRVLVVSFLVSNYRSYKWDYEETNECKKFSTVIKGRDYALIRQEIDEKCNTYLSVNFGDEDLMVNAYVDICVEKLWLLLWKETVEKSLDEKWGIILSELN